MKTARLLTVVLILVALLVLSGCGTGTAASANPAPTVTMAAASTTIAPNGSTTLTWSSSAASSVSIDHGVGSVAASGQATVKPAQSTTYTITAAGAGGSTTASVTVTVSAASTTLAITATPATVATGVASTLTVEVTNATSVVISNNLNSITYTLPVAGGTQVVTPTQTTTYTATATGGGASVTASATVTVAPAPTITIAANPATVTSGVATTLMVSATNATNVVISNNVGPTTYTLPAAGGTQVVNPTQTTSYTATAMGAGGTATRTVVVTMTAAPGTITITASPSAATVIAGQQQQFTSNDPDATWSITPSTSGTISNTGLFTAGTTTGPVAVTATDAAKRLSSSATATVIAFGIGPNPANVVAGQTVTLTANAPATWAVTNGNGSITNASSASPTAIYTALNTAGTATITATAADSTVTATDAVNIGALTVTPSTASSVAGHTQQFAANAAVTWTASGGTIDSTGLFTAPAVIQDCIITATEKGTTATATAIDHVTEGNATSLTGVYTYKYDNGRTGLNPNETKLGIAAVTNGANFGKLGSWSLDGSIFTQPLYVPGVSIQNVTYNLLYVGTENDSVYALNADKPGTVLWKRSFLTATGTIGQGYSGGRTSIGGNVGITGTPVIDPVRNWLYVVARTTEGGNQVQRLHAIDITTGADVLTATPINPVVSGTGDGTTQVTFLPLTQNQRPALLLDNGVVYVTFASFGDYDPYHGWVIAFDAATLNYIDAYNATPNGGGGGSWMAGAGPAGDSNGNVYFATGNGRPDATAKFDPPNDLPNSLLKLKVISGKLTLVDYFSPYNAKCLSNDDLDLGSSGPMLIPDQFAGFSTLAIASKEGRAYLLDQNSMGKWNPSGDSQILSSVLFNPAACGQAGFDANSPMRVYGSPAYWNGNIYFGSAFGPLQQYNITTGQFGQPIKSAHIYAANGQLGRGPLVMVSSNGTSDAIVWTSENDLTGKGWLRAFDATNVANELYNSNFGGGSNFIIPMVGDGHVYVTGQATLYQYGLLR